MDDLKLIKKNYGEAMSHLCRELFPTILESDGLLFKLISDHFHYSKDLCEDIIENNLISNFKNYIYNLSDLEITKNEVTKSPKELLDEAGYILYECTNYEEVEQFRKYYKKSEELCTFRDIDDRLKTNYVFFAIKKDVDNIKREDFSKPERQDLYGTSVISIQFTKGNINTLSIKNRYNHTVKNPDATFSNNLDNIIEGLTGSFNQEYDLNINSNEFSFEIPRYVKANDKKYYKYNYEINNIYYCPNNIIIDNFKVKRYDKERYIVLDYFILDMKEKTINLYDIMNNDAFIDGFNDIEKIEIEKQNDNKKIIINNEVIISIDKLNQIIKYENKNMNEISDFFLFHNETLIELILLNVTKIRDCFLLNNETLIELILPKVERIGNSFLLNNNSLRELNLQNVEYIGDRFLYSNEVLTEFIAPNLECVFDLYNKRFLKNLEVLEIPDKIKEELGLKEKVIKKLKKIKKE